MPDVHPCVVCSTRDDHPKHQVVSENDITSRHHIDCGSMMSPPCGMCTLYHSEAPKSKGVMVTGDAMRKHLVSLMDRPRYHTHHADGTVTVSFEPDGPADADDSAAPTPGSEA